jgi:hypothetical protein
VVQVRFCTVVGAEPVPVKPKVVWLLAAIEPFHDSFVTVAIDPLPVYLPLHS